MSIEKTKQALLEAAANHVEGKPVDPVAKSVIEAMTAIKWSKAPEGSKCLGCVRKRWSVPAPSWVARGRATSAVRRVTITTP
jgi:hypothetical protein